VVLCYGRTAIFREHASDAESYEDGSIYRTERMCPPAGNFFRRLRLNNVMNGVVRAEVLRRTELLKGYFSSDIVLFAELALRGKFVELPERMFFRRMTADTASKLATADRLRDYFDPQRRRPHAVSALEAAAGLFFRGDAIGRFRYGSARAFMWHLLREAYWAQASSWRTCAWRGAAISIVVATRVIGAGNAGD